MGFHLEIWTRGLLAAGVVLATVCSAGAQSRSRRPGEAIVFSSPDGDEVNSNVPSLTARPPAFLNPAPAVQPPSVDISVPPQTEALPLPPMVSPAQFQRMQRQLDERKNWALMTPEQILGVPTPEKIFGVQDRDIFGRAKDETVVQQFYQRQEQSRARTNDYAAAGSTSHWGPPDGQGPQWNLKLFNPAAGGPGHPTLMDQFLKGTPDNSVDSAPAPAAAGEWFNTFGPPAPPARPAPGQQAAVGQFQQLFQPQSPAGQAAKVSAFNGPIYSTHSTTPSSASAQFTPPFSESYPPLSSGIGLPPAAPPLPGLLGATNQALLATPLEWKPQPAPWLSPTPQLGVAPQRKF